MSKMDAFCDLVIDAIDELSVLNKIDDASPEDIMEKLDQVIRAQKLFHEACWEELRALQRDPTPARVINTPPLEKLH